MRVVDDLSMQYHVAGAHFSGRSTGQAERREDGVTSASQNPTTINHSMILSASPAKMFI